MAVFEKNEYEQRLQNVKQRMAEAELDVLLLTDPANINYLSGYDGWSFYVHQMLVVAAEADEPTWIGRAQDLGGARLTTVVSPERLIGYPDDYVQSTTKHPMDFVANFLAENGWSNGSIGVEMDCYYFTAACYRALAANLPSATLQDATSLVNWVRSIKSAGEIKYMRQAARIVEKAMQTAIDAIEPGVRQCDVAAAISHAQISGLEEFGGDYTSIAPLIPAGAGTATPHLTWSDDRFEPGHSAIVEIAGCRHRYHSPLARTVQLGDPPSILRNLSDAVLDGINAAIEAARPGARCEEVEAAWRSEFSKSGFVKESRIGYSVGLNYPPDWGEHTMSLRPGDKTVLAENMTLHLIPGVWQEDVGIDISETILITETGCETLANFRRELIVKL